MLAVFVGCRALPAASSGDPLRRPTRSLRSGTFARRNHYLGGSAKLRGVVPRTRERRRNAEQRRTSRAAARATRAYYERSCGPQNWLTAGCGNSIRLTPRARDEVPLAAAEEGTGRHERI